MNDASDRPRRLDTAELRHDSHGAVLVRKPRAETVVLNRTALALWELCDGRTSVDEMVAAVTTLFAVDEARARADVRDALASMRRAGVVG